MAVTRLLCRIEMELKYFFSGTRTTVWWPMAITGKIASDIQKNN